MKFFIAVLVLGAVLALCNSRRQKSDKNPGRPSHPKADGRKPCNNEKPGAQSSPDTDGRRPSNDENFPGCYITPPEKYFYSSGSPFSLTLISFWVYPLLKMFTSATSHNKCINKGLFIEVIDHL
ncbi:hypothetical protein TNIN_157391 [Trichonephila inaurata madagascariensis]|uniref:Secreted protein n=1 Tax=Trichonephila inaurata madagascariensis TaxID=2747483 RepID=A0A8X7BUH0_9ARAC|nr:hypothetical protein TNIN_157391 [Trichonephila inaurata madagascariensis]